jgi:hypothetical protein
MTVASARPTAGPLTSCAENPRYFADTTGRPVYLTGSHTWANLQEMGPTDPPEPFDYDRWLTFLVDHDHTFQRLWMFENAFLAPWAPDGYWFEPLPWERTGPGVARDGKPRFDLTRFDERWFQRLRDRVQRAGACGVYTAVMLFEGWSVDHKEWGAWGPQGPNPWPGHPFHPDNNVNGIDGGGAAVHTLSDPRVLALQRAYVERVIDAVGDLDNVLYEIGNEFTHSAENVAWQEAIAALAREHMGDERRRPVLMTIPWPGGDNQALFKSSAEAVSPGGWRGQGQARWEYDPPDMAGAKVVLVDTDHLWGVGGTVDWVWRSFIRGLNPIYMDPYGYDHLNPVAPDEDVRRAMGATSRVARTLDLARMVPAGERTSTGFALADGPRTILVYQPYPGRFQVDLRDAGGPARLTWIDPVSGERTAGATVATDLVVPIDRPQGVPDAPVALLAEVDG